MWLRDRWGLGENRPLTLVDAGNGSILESLSLLEPLLHPRWFCVFLLVHIVSFLSSARSCAAPRSVLNFWVAPPFFISWFLRWGVRVYCMLWSLGWVCRQLMGGMTSGPAPVCCLLFSTSELFSWNSQLSYYYVNANANLLTMLRNERNLGKKSQYK
jgi:hypothetical protein